MSLWRRLFGGRDNNAPSERERWAQQYASRPEGWVKIDKNDPAAEAYLYQEQVTLLLEAGQFEQALQTARMAEASVAYHPLLGQDHPAYAQTLNNLAVVHQVMGNFAAAEPLYREALEIRRHIFGKYHWQVRNSLDYLASLYEAMGDDAKATSFMEQALEIQRRLEGTKR